MWSHKIQLLVVISIIAAWMGDIVGEPEKLAKLETEPLNQRCIRRSDEPSKPKFELLPNLSRSPELVNRQVLSVNNVSIGMTVSQVFRVLGSPDKVWGKFSTGATLEYYPSEGEPVDSLTIQVFDCKVVGATGTILQHSGEEVCRSNYSLESLNQLLGPNDHDHLLGPGASPVLCWASQSVVLEVSIHNEDRGGMFFLGDPEYFWDKPHVWYSSCGAP